MFLQHKNLTIRNATAKDAALLANWWNDGKVMAHAGFPEGLHITPEKIAMQLDLNCDNHCRRLILQNNHRPIGEMCYTDQKNGVVEIGIKICEISEQEKGHGRCFLSMLIAELFAKKYKKIILDTDLENTRAQHVYNLLGFSIAAVNENSWENQLGQQRSSIVYELYENQFVSYLK